MWVHDQGASVGGQVGAQLALPHKLHIQRGDTGGSSRRSKPREGTQVGPTSLTLAQRGDTSIGPLQLSLTPIVGTQVGPLQA